MLSADALEAFKAIYKQENGVELIDEEASEQAINLLTIFNVIYRPVLKEWDKELITAVAKNDSEDLRQ